MKRIILLSIVLAAFLTSGCGNNAQVGTSTGNPSSPQTYFPSGLTVASPFDTSEDTSSTSSLSAITQTLSRQFASRYTNTTEKIDAILNGTAATQCQFRPLLFLTREADAACYGPTVSYTGHPDALSTDPLLDGQLPGGDVGLWSENDSSTGHACAAAQLNARMQGVRDNTIAALKGLATLVCVLQVNELTLPSNSSQDLALVMNDLSLPNVSFNSASIAHSDATGSDQWSYELNFDFVQGGNIHRISVDMIHLPGTTTSDYQGRLSIQANQFFSGGNCPSNQITRNSSLLYNRASATDLTVETRSGDFCGHNVDGLTSGLTDPSKKFDASSAPSGWGNNFTIFTANFNPSSLIGNYNSRWQAGPNDQATRALNVNVSQPDSAAGLVGQAYYGFGADIATSTGTIDGLFCNWAGPNGAVGEVAMGNRTKLVTLAQYQAMSENLTTGKFASTATNITYAPTNSCDYDGTGTFTFDATGDGVIDTVATDAVTNDLVNVTEITSVFTNPTPPANL